MSSSLPSRRLAVVLAMREDLPRKLFGQEAREHLTNVADVDLTLCLDDFTSPAARSALATAEVLLTSWSCPRISPDVLDAASRLRAVVHAAGSVKGHVDRECWQRGIAVSSAAEANAVPVAEFTLAAVLLAGKRAQLTAHLYRERRGRLDPSTYLADAGNYRRTVGVIGASRIGRRVIALLRSFDIHVVLYDPFIDQVQAEALGTRLASLDELVASSDVVTLHAPALSTTRHLIDRNRLSLMRDGATLVNTARGSLVDTPALEAELLTGRLNAVLDVTDPEPLAPDSPLFTLPNVVLTPHIAGSVGVELFRLGDWAVAEVERFATGRPFLGGVQESELESMA